MLAQKYRLTKQKDFKEIFNFGKKSFTSCFSFRFKKNNLDYPRLTVVVANKVAKSAVKRNLLKRKIREIIRLNILKKIDHYDVIVNVLSPALEKNYEFLEVELISLFTKNKLI